MIETCASVFDQATFRRSTGAVKLLLLLGHERYLPCSVVIAEARPHKVLVARTLIFPSGTILVIDRDDVDYALLADPTRQRVLSGTRLKANAEYARLRTRYIPACDPFVRDERQCASDPALNGLTALPVLKYL